MLAKRSGQRRLLDAIRALARCSLGGLCGARARGRWAGADFSERWLGHQSQLHGLAAQAGEQQC